MSELRTVPPHPGQDRRPRPGVDVDLPWEGEQGARNGQADLVLGKPLRHEHPRRPLLPAGLTPLDVGLAAVPPQRDRQPGVRVIAAGLGPPAPPWSDGDRAREPAVREV